MSVVTAGESKVNAASQVPTTPPIVRGRVADGAARSKAYRLEGTVWTKELVETVPKFTPETVIGLPPVVGMLRTVAAVITGASKVTDLSIVDVRASTSKLTLRPAPRFLTELPCWTRCVTQASEVCETQDADWHRMPP